MSAILRIASGDPLLGVKFPVSPQPLLVSIAITGHPGPQDLELWS